MSDSNEMNTKPKHPKLMPPSSRTTAEKGIRTTADYATLMSDTIADIISGRMPIEVAETVVRLGNSLLKTAELQYRYGHRTGGTQAEQAEPLRLVSGK